MERDVKLIDILPYVCLHTYTTQMNVSMIRPNAQQRTGLHTPYAAISSPAQSIKYANQ